MCLEYVTGPLISTGLGADWREANQATTAATINAGRIQSILDLRDGGASIFCFGFLRAMNAGSVAQVGFGVERPPLLGFCETFQG